MAVADCAARLDRRPRVIGIGVNRTAPRFIGGLIGEIRRNFEKPVVVYPNTGQVWDATSRQWRGAATALDFGAAALDWFRLGASWIGGCCGTTPDHVRGIRAAHLAADPDV